MEFEFGGGPAQYVSEAQAALESVTYPLEKVGGKVRVNFPVEPACPGHSEFACTQMYIAGPYVAIIEVRDSTALPLDQGWHPFSGVPGEWNGRNFYRESVVHELGHVIAGTFTASPDARAEMCGLFRFMDIMGPEDGRPGQPGDWNGAPTWAHHIEEAVAETFKDVFMPKRDRQYDNRTAWRLPQANFRRFLELMGLDFEPKIGSRERRLYTPDLGHPTELTAVQNGHDNWVEYPQPDGWWDHADFVFKQTDTGYKVWWGVPGRGNFLVLFNRYALHERPLGILGGSITFGHIDIIELGGRNVTAFSDLTIPNPDYTKPYATDGEDPSTPVGWWGDFPSTWGVGWDGELFRGYTNFARYGMRWRMVDSGVQQVYVGTPVDNYLQVCSKMVTYSDGVFPAGVPSISGPLAFPRLDILHDLGYADDANLNLQMVLQFEHRAFDPVTGNQDFNESFASTPSAPGGVEKWAATLWGISWFLPPDTMPPWPYTDLAEAGAGPVLAVRRSKMTAGVR